MSQILVTDQNILIRLNSFFIGRGPQLDQLFKFLAVYFVYTLPVILLLMWFLVKDEKKRIAMVMSMLSLVLGQFVFNKLIAMLWFRPRPDVATVGLKEVFFHRPDFSFPSDHSAALFAITFTMYLFGYKKAGNWFLLYALVITFSRVVIAVHYPLDIVGGAAVGFVAASIIYWLRKPLKKFVFDPIVFVLKKVELA